MNAEQKEKLTYIVETVASYEREKKEINERIKEICAEAEEKHQLHPKTVKRLAKEHNMDEAEREEQRVIEHQIEECRLALGWLADTPLGASAVENLQDEITDKKKKPKTRKSGNTEEQSEVHA